jgi:hypothetical protein
MPQLSQSMRAIGERSLSHVIRIVILCPGLSNRNGRRA